MTLSLFQILILSAIQGAAELLPVSSSAHVVIAEKLMGLDPSTPEMALLLVMLHTGTMFAVIVYFRDKWLRTYFRNMVTFKRFAVRAVLATAITGAIGELLTKAVERVMFPGQTGIDVEQLFSHLELIAPALAAAGVLILLAGLTENRAPAAKLVYGQVGLKQAGWIGAVQGLCLPFRGFSRSGATISTGMLAGASKVSAENFSFAMAVLLTPPVIAREAVRLIKAQRVETGAHLASAFLPGMIGAACAFLAGLIALKWLSTWLERGRWYLFGIYCLVASVAVTLVHRAGY